MKGELAETIAPELDATVLADWYESLDLDCVAFRYGPKPVEELLQALTIHEAPAEAVVIAEDARRQYDTLRSAT